MNDYAAVFVAISLGTLAWLALAGLVAWVWHRLQDTRREMPAPPEPEPIDPRDLCSILACPERATTAILDRPLCAGHAYAIRSRGPYDREAS